MNHSDKADSGADLIFYKLNFVISKMEKDFLEQQFHNFRDSTSRAR